MSISGSIANLAPRENFPEVGTFSPPYKSSNNDVKLDKIIDVLNQICIELRFLRNEIQEYHMKEDLNQLD